MESSRTFKKIWISKLKGCENIFPKAVLESAVIITNAIIKDMPPEDKEMYLFDRICDEVCLELYGEHRE